MVVLVDEVGGSNDGKVLTCPAHPDQQTHQPTPNHQPTATYLPQPTPSEKMSDNFR